jgi:hypothetical protein
MNKPAYQKMLPSAARAAVVNYILEKLEAAPRTYLYINVLVDFQDDTDSWLRSNLYNMYQEALEEWEERHPWQYNEDGGYSRK